MSGPFLLGLTGSIGMGKTTTAEIFSDAGIPVWNADQAVHDLYMHDQGLATALLDIVPDAVPDGKIDRAILRKAFGDDPSLLPIWEAIVHPAVATQRAAFLDQHRHEELIVLDIPLIFEKNMQDEYDAVLVVSVDADEQRRRVLARGTMTEVQFEQILAKQVPDAEKRAKADFVIETYTVSSVEKAVHDLIAQIRAL